MVKVLLLKIAVFLVILFAPLYVLQFYVDKGLRKAALGEYGVWNDIYSARIKPGILVVGSSRATVNVSTPILSETFNTPAYNIGIDGGDFNLEYLRFQVYMQHNKKPETVILSLHTADLQKNEGIFNQEQFIPFLNDSLIRDHTSGYSASFDNADFYVPSMKYRSDFQSIFDGIKLNMGKPVARLYYAPRVDGYESRNRKWDDSFAKLKASGKTFDIKFNNDLVSKLNDLVKTCSDNGIKLIFVYSPEYKGVQSYFVNREKAMAYYKKVARENNISFLDYSDHPISSDTTYFYNSEHLNSGGSAYFTKILAKDIAGLENEANSTKPSITRL